MSVATKTKTNPPIVYDNEKYMPSFFQYHVYYCIILRDRQNQLNFFSEQYIKNLSKKNLIAA